MYQALYRKWRPRTFDDVVGQDHVTETLKRQIITERLSHAYLFVGTRGTGKTTCAKILARAVNCERPDNGNPCNECQTCRGIENGSILDVLELDAASNNGVDNVRALREEAVYTPASAKKRVYIIDEVHMLTASAFNALLKILEEPPEHLLFILATTELHKVPATILSRCQRFSFRRLTPSVITARLLKVAENEGLTLSREASDMLARLAEGSMRDALSLLDQCASDTEIDANRVLDTIGLAGNSELLSLAGAIMESDAASALGVLDRLFADGRDMAGLLGEMAALIRDALVFLLAPDSPLLSGGFSGTELSEITEKASAERLLYCLETIKDAVLGLSRGGSARLSVETCLIRMCNDRLSGGTDAVLARLDRLEKQIAAGSGYEPRLIRPSPVCGEPEAVPKEPPAPAPPETNADTSAPDAETEPPAAEKPGSAGKPSEPGDARENDYWGDILALLRGDKAAYTILSDKTRTSAELRDNVLVVRAENAFALNMIESKTVLEPLKDAAQKALGHAVSIKAELGGEIAKDAQSKLDKLGAFQNVKFE